MKIPDHIKVEKLPNGTHELRCLRCIRSINVTHPESTHALGFYVHHKHEMKIA